MSLEMMLWAEEQEARWEARQQEIAEKLESGEINTNGIYKKAEMKKDDKEQVENLLTEVDNLVVKAEESCKASDEALRESELHATCSHPEYVYDRTEGQRKSWDDIDTPPEGDGWERNVDRGRNGWERFDYTEESYWRRKMTVEELTEKLSRRLLRELDIPEKYKPKIQNFTPLHHMPLTARHSVPSYDPNKVFEPWEIRKVDGEAATYLEYSWDFNKEDREYVRAASQGVFVRDEVEIDENTSDGYHTFKELYEMRLLLTAGMFNELAERAYDQCAEPFVCKSKLHSDGSVPFGGGWFIVVATLPNVGQISFHYELKDWDLFYAVPEVTLPPEYDGHTTADVADRLRRYLT